MAEGGCRANEIAPESGLVPAAQTLPSVPRMADTIRPAAPSASEVMEAFRAGRSRSPVHPRERLLLLALGAAVVAATWIAPSGAPWSLVLTAILAVAAFGIALPPRPIVEGEDDVDWSNRWRIRKLVTLPPFWIGLAFVAFLGAQHASPSLRANYDILDDRWVTAPLAEPGLFTSVEAPFGETNALRAAVLHGVAWLLLCAAWVGLTRRRSVLALLWILGLNALALAVAGLALRLAGGGPFPWVHTADGELTIAAFTRASSSAAFGVLACACCLGLAVHHFVESRRHLLKSDPSGIFFFGAIVCAGFTAFSGHRILSLGMAGVVGIFVAYSVFALIWRNDRGLARWVGVSVAVLAGALAIFVIREGMARGILSGLRPETPSAGVDYAQAKAEARAIAWQLANERPWTGWGAGSFRYLAAGRQFPGEDGTPPPYLSHARSELLELATEVGVLGLLLLAAATGWLVRQVARANVISHPLLCFLAAGLGVIALATTRESLLGDPAVLVYGTLLLGCAALVALMERPSRFRAAPSPVVPDPNLPKSTVRI